MILYATQILTARFHLTPYISALLTPEPVYTWKCVWQDLLPIFFGSDIGPLLKNLFLPKQRVMIAFFVNYSFMTQKHQMLFNHHRYIGAVMGEGGLA